ncbi:MAG: YcbK family protein [Burkholderiaceae bacterium]
MCTEHSFSSERRDLLALPVAASLAVLAPAPARAAPPAAASSDNQLASLIAEKRELWLVRGSEELRATYWSARGGADRDAYLNICWLMRDVQADRVFVMDRRLLDVLCGIQTWLARSGVEAPIQINSGYRTRKTNNKLEGAALDSRHLIGQAADISMAGVSNIKLAGMASVLGRGGTGFYVGKGFVHVDCGDERIWIDQKKKPPSGQG